MILPVFGAISTGDGSCFKQGDKTVSGGLSFSHPGVYAAADLGLHDLLSIGGAGGYNRYTRISGWKYRQFPVLGRIALHPLNFSFLADVILIRDKVDIYGGIAAGYIFISSSWKGVTDPIGKPETSGIKIGEYLGISLQLNDRLSIFAEDCGEASNFALGVRWGF